MPRVVEEFSVAPMLDVTDRHCRMFLRLLSARAKLYTEMTVDNALIHGDRARFLDFDPRERPLAIQLAGAEPARLAKCARLAAAAGYDEINLNIGCPSARVQNAKFGACLMAEPKLVADCVAAMRDAVDIPVTVKTRAGIDHLDSYEHLAAFVAQVAQGGCRRFIIHARKAWLHGLSPKQNRQAPKLQYARVYRLKRDFPALVIIINGGITTLKDARAHLQHVDGVMVGREARERPWLLSAVDREIFHASPHQADAPPPTRADAVRAYLPYIEQQLARGVHLRHLARPLMSLFHGQPGARHWRRHLSEHTRAPGAGTETVYHALRFVEDAAQRFGEQKPGDIPVE